MSYLILGIHSTLYRGEIYKRKWSDLLYSHQRHTLHHPIPKQTGCSFKKHQPPDSYHQKPHLHLQGRCSEQNTTPPPPNIGSLTTDLRGTETFASK